MATNEIHLAGWLLEKVKSAIATGCIEVDPRYGIRLYGPIDAKAMGQMVIVRIDDPKRYEAHPGRKSEHWMIPLSEELGMLGFLGSYEDFSMNSSSSED